MIGRCFMLEGQENVLFGEIFLADCFKYNDAFIVMSLIPVFPGLEI